MNAWLKRYVFNLDLDRESVSERILLSGRLSQSLGAKYEKGMTWLLTQNKACNIFHGILSSDKGYFD